MNSWINLTALWKIVVIGLLAGAGLPALFALGLRALNPRGQGATVTAGGPAAEADGPVVTSGPLGVLLAAVCFLVILAAIGWGIYSIVHNS
ncbi:MAG TPA: hypothetical protein VGX23_23310 [Actinocrinis sp.]|nr:hypothetical protein [Actinocrinis sp.]